MSVTIDAVMVGTPEPFGPNGELSAIRKVAVKGPVAVDAGGPAGDQQAWHGHGGPDKALLHHPAEHYATYRSFFPEFALEPGGLGENLSTHGMTELDVCIGDRYRVEHTGLELEVAEPRQPCWKLGHNAGLLELPELIQRRTATGWYYRVVSPGSISAGEQLQLVGRPHPDWTLARIVQGFYETPLDREFLTALTLIPELGHRWREYAAQRLNSGQVEDWTDRLYGPCAKQL